MKLRSLVLSSFALFAAGCAGPTVQHQGTHIHIDAGVVNSGSSASSVYGGTMKVSGTGVGFSFALGGAVNPNFILGGDLWMSTVMTPRLTVNGQSDAPSNLQYNVVGFGPLLTYYLPQGFFLSAVPSLTRLTLADTSSDGGSGSTEMGVGFRGAIGKEWCTGGDWGIGVAGVFHAASNSDRNQGPTWGTRGFGVVMSFSMN